MSSINVFTFTGRLGADPIVRYTPTGKAVWNARVAVDCGYGQNKSAVWVNIACFGKLAELYQGFDLKKGASVAGSGELSNREYTTKDGEKRTSLEVNLNSLVNIGGRPSGETAERPGANQPATGGFEDDDIPF